MPVRVHIEDLEDAARFSSATAETANPAAATSNDNHALCGDSRSAARKTCPACGANITGNANFCGYCGSTQAQQTTGSPVPQTHGILNVVRQSLNDAWFLEDKMVILFLLFITPLGLVFMWIKPDWST